jgi:hypothetical protein
MCLHSMFCFCIFLLVFKHLRARIDFLEAYGNEHMFTNLVSLSKILNPRYF